MMTDYSVGATSESRSLEAAQLRYIRPSDCKNIAPKAVKPAALDPVIDGDLSEPELAQLAARDHVLLRTSERKHRRVT